MDCPQGADCADDHCDLVHPAERDLGPADIDRAYSLLVEGGFADDEARVLLNIQ